MLLRKPASIRPEHKAGLPVRKARTRVGIRERRATRASGLSQSQERRVPPQDSISIPVKKESRAARVSSERQRLEPTPAKLVPLQDSISIPARKGNKAGRVSSERQRLEPARPKRVPPRDSINILVKRESKAE